MKGGLAGARGDIVAFIDDDCVPRREWLARLVGNFMIPRLVAWVAAM